MQPSLRLSLELEPGSEPITGRLSDGDGKQHVFTGWLDLAAALEAVRHSQQLTAFPTDPAQGDDSDAELDK